MRPLNDRAVERGRADPSSLLAAAYAEFAGPVLGYLTARGVDDPEAVTQDVFLALHPQLASVRGGAAGLRTLIFAIAHARSVDHYRQKERRPVSTVYAPEQDLRAAPSAEDVVVSRQRVLDLMDTLPDDQREVLELRVIADLSIEQAAQIMGRSAGAIKQLQLRALAALRERVIR